MWTNLNRIDIETAEDPAPPRAHSARSGVVEVVFEDHPARLIERIASAEVVVGCVAWLTHPAILAALAKKPAALVVQKEDFLRPDGATTKEQTRAAYARINGLERRQCRPLLASMCTSRDPTLDGVRCVGMRPTRNAESWVKMHHKFLVFGRFVEEDRDPDGEVFVEPYAVWTGSFNFTHNATRSFENAVYIADEKIAQAYFYEFQQVAALSEPLDWSSEYVEPEWRIGT